MLALPTGAGKTVIAARIFQGALAKGNAAIFTVPAISLIDQTVAAFEAEGIHAVGVIQAQHEKTDGEQPIQVCSIQSLMNREIPMAALVIVDEAHRWFDFYSKWMTSPAWTKVPFIGLSATPWTKGLGKHYDDLLIPATISELIEAGYLTPFRVFAPSEPDLRGVKTVAGDFNQEQVADRMQRDNLTADIVKTWQERWGQDKTLVFGVDRAHAKALQAQFAGAGIAAGYVDMDTPLEERKEIELLFHEGHLKVVCNIGTLTTGIDWDVRCIVLARPTKSEMLYVQIIGRGLRTAPGKADLLVLDHSSTTKRLGFVTDIHHAELHGGDWKPGGSLPEEKKEKLPTPCPMCQALRHPGVHVCPSCGFAPTRQSLIASGAGELVEMTRATVADKAQWYREILGYAEYEGKSQGWASHTFRAKFGVWPNHYRHLTGIPPSNEVRSFIRHRAYEYTKANKAGRAG